MYRFTTKLEPFARGFLSCESSDKGVKPAAGFLQAAKDAPLSIDLNSGLVSGFIMGATGFYYGNGVFMDQREMEKLIEEHPEDREDLLYIAENLKPYLAHCTPESFFTEEQTKAREDGACWGGVWMGHAVPNYIDICNYGTVYFKEKSKKYRALNPQSKELYDGIDLIIEAIETLAGRYYELACQYESTPEIEAIKETFKNKLKTPCKDFAQASIAFVMLFSLEKPDSPGHFDQYMYPFWKVTQREVARKYLNSVWQFFKDTRTWNLCISGSDENRNDLSNDLTYEILELVKTYKYETPNLTMRCHRNTPEKLLKAAYEAICAGTGLPALYNDEAVCTALERLGIPPSDSHRYVMNGCNQIDIQGKSHMGLEDGEVNFAKALEYTLHNGYSTYTGNKIGPETGSPESFKTFEEFYKAFLKQLDNITRLSTVLSNTLQEMYAREAPNPYRSMLIEGCMEKGLDYKNHGPVYGHGQILAEAIADTADSLAAIKKYVYEEKRFTLSELVKALENNFEGYEKMRQTLKNCPYKFGNDIEYIDSIAKDMVDHFNTYLLTLETWRGGKYSGGCSPFVRAPEHASRIGAQANGRKKEELLLADSIGASPGCDTNGPTALMKSCLKFDHTLPGSGFILNLKFNKSIFRSPKGEEIFLNLCKTYFENKGQMLTFTVVSEEDLKDAQVHPENHEDLIVRVGGYSDRFVAISKDLQDNVIARTSL